MNDRTLSLPRALAASVAACAAVPFLATALLRVVSSVRSTAGLATVVAAVWVVACVGALAQRKPIVRAVGAGLIVGTAAWLAILVWLTTHAVPSWS